MPVHFNSFVGKKENESELLSSILMPTINNPEEICGSKDKEAFHMTKYILNQETKEKIGKIVVTMIAKEETKATEVVDIDIVLLSEQAIELNFLERLDKSSEANEYYDVSTVDEEKHFQIETVNFYSLEKENLENTKQKVYLSCFPFQLNIFNNIEELNREFGFSKPIKVGKTDMKVFGYDENFIGVNIGDEDPSSFIIGKVNDFTDVTAIMGEKSIAFTIIKLNTAMGVIPVAASRDQFDLGDLAVGKILFMLTDVKADFVK